MDGGGEVMKWWLIVPGLSLLILSACGVKPDQVPIEQAASVPTDSPLPTPVQADKPVSPVGTPVPLQEEGEMLVTTRVLEAAAGQFGLPQDKIEILSIEEVEWPNTCLGCAGPDTFCAQVITPGYRIVLRIGDALREAHTDATGRTIRFCDQVGAVDIGAVPQGRPAPDEVWEQFKKLLAYWQEKKRGYGLEQVQSTWEGRDITPRRMLGAARYRFTADQWEVIIGCPIASNASCEATLTHATMGLVWKGRIGRDGEVVEDGTPSDLQTEAFCDEGVEPSAYNTWKGVDIRPLEDGFSFVHRVPYVCCSNVIFATGGNPSRGVIRVIETNIGEVCRCMCPVVVAGEVHGLSPKPYTVEFWGIQKEPAHHLELLEMVEITVP